MKKKQSVLCIIPIRSGSKTLKNKNIKEFKGKPLSFHNIKTAEASNIFLKIVVATDSHKYIRILKKMISIDKTEFFIRSKKSASDTAQTELVLKEVIKKFKNYDIITLIQVTTPHLKPLHLKKALIKFNKFNYDSLFSSYASKRFFWRNNRNNYEPLNYNFKKRPMHQNIKETYVENGAFYIFKKKQFLKKNNRLFNKIGTYVMTENESIEIDSLQDFKKAENQN